VLDEIGGTFVRNRQKNRAEAYLQFQIDLMSHLGTLSSLIPTKDIIGLSMDIEHYLKGISGEGGVSPDKQMQEFLKQVETAEVAA
jgi:hypothetical protein